MVNNQPNHSNLLVDMQNSGVGDSNKYPTYSAATSYHQPPQQQQASVYSKPDSRESYASAPKKPKKEVDSSKAYKCAECEYSFNRRDHLTRHSLVSIDSALLTVISVINCLIVIVGAQQVETVSLQLLLQGLYA